MIVDVLPVELWLKIFTLACTDGGKTGCALSIVSHTVRELSASCRFHTIALHSFAQLDTFNKRLNASREPRPPIHHLYVINPMFNSFGFTSPWASFLVRILAYAAPTLKSLVYVDYPPIFGNHTFPLRTAFPQLTMLTTMALDIEALAEHAPLYKIQCLHVVFSEYNTRLDGVLKVLGDVFPALVKLRMGYANQSLAQFLILYFQLEGEEFLGAHQRMDEAGILALAQSSRALRLLQTVYVRRDLINPDDLGTFDAIASRTEQNDKLGKLVLLPAPSANTENVRDALQAEENWLDIVSGGQGVWRAAEGSM